MNVIIKWILGCLIFCLAGFAHAQNVHGVLRVVKGDVQIKSGQTGQLTKARLGAQVDPKDVIITGPDSRAKIVMVDNNEINVSPDSQVEIQHYEYDPNQGKKEVLLNVIYGKVRSKVEQHYDGKTTKFEVKTPSAVAGVRGTDFMTSFDKASGSSQVVTFRGAVAFGLPGPNGSIANAVSVTPGKTASSTGGAPPNAPTTMPKDQLAKMDQESKVDANSPGPKGGPAPASEGGSKSSPSNSSSSSGNGASNSNGTSSGSSQASSNSSGGSATTSSPTDASGGQGSGQRRFSGSSYGSIESRAGGSWRNTASRGVFFGQYASITRPCRWGWHTYALITHSPNGAPNDSHCQPRGANANVHDLPIAYTKRSTSKSGDSHKPLNNDSLYAVFSYSIAQAYYRI